MMLEQKKRHGQISKKRTRWIFTSLKHYGNFHNDERKSYGTPKKYRESEYYHAFALCSIFIYYVCLIISRFRARGFYKGGQTC